jgi:hypothetical protein
MKDGKWGDFLNCPSCQVNFPIWDSQLGALTLAEAKASIQTGAIEPRMLTRWGLFWDDQFNPRCPVDKTLLFVYSHTDDSKKYGSFDMLKCPACNQGFPIRDEQIGLITLTHAKQDIEAGLRTGRISD